MILKSLKAISTIQDASNRYQQISALGKNGNFLTMNLKCKVIHYGKKSLLYNEWLYDLQTDTEEKDLGVTFETQQSNLILEISYQKQIAEWA